MLRQDFVEGLDLYMTMQRRLHPDKIGLFGIQVLDRALLGIRHWEVLEEIAKLFTVLRLTFLFC